MGRCKRDRNSAPIRAGLRIRLDVVGRVFQSPGQAVKLPTIDEYAREFGLSRRTVAYEFRRLADEGYIHGRPGIGTFTNPERSTFSPYERVKRVVGIITGDSQALFESNSGWAMLSAVGTELIPDVAHPRHLMLAGYLADDIRKEILQQNLDALVWISPPANYHELVSRLQDDGLPVITTTTRVAGVACVRSDYDARGAAIGGILADEGRDHPLWRGLPPFEYECWKKTASVLRKRGLAASEKDVARDHSEFRGMLEQLLSEGRPPKAIYAIDGLALAIVELFARHGLDAYRDTCLICSADTVRNHPEFRGITYAPPYIEMGKIVVGLLAGLFAGRPPAPRLYTLADTVTREN